MFDSIEFRRWLHIIHLLLLLLFFLLLFFLRSISVVNRHLLNFNNRLLFMWIFSHTLNHLCIIVIMISPTLLVFDLYVNRWVEHTFLIGSSISYNFDIFSISIHSFLNYLRIFFLNHHYLWRYFCYFFIFHM